VNYIRKDERIMVDKYEKRGETKINDFIKSL